MSILQTRLNSLLSTFTVPPEKRGDLHWLNENIAFKNSGHMHLSEVQSIIIALLNEKNKNRVKTFVK